MAGRALGPAGAGRAVGPAGVARPDRDRDRGRACCQSAAGREALSPGEVELHPAPGGRRGRGARRRRDHRGRDRVGNVLAVYQMTGAPTVPVQISAERTVVDPAGLAGRPSTGSGRPTPSRRGGDRQGDHRRLSVVAAATPSAPAPRARSSRRTSTPAPRASRAGRLFGVQFSQLPCSDLSVRFASNAVAARSTRGSAPSARRSASRPIRAACRCTRTAPLVGGHRGARRRHLRPRPQHPQPRSQPRRADRASPAPPASRRPTTCAPTGSRSTAAACASPMSAAHDLRTDPADADARQPRRGRHVRAA